MYTGLTQNTFSNLKNAIKCMFEGGGILKIVRNFIKFKKNISVFKLGFIVYAKNIIILQRVKDLQSIYQKWHIQTR
jgi:hypothetical protein